MRLVEGAPSKTCVVGQSGVFYCGLEWCGGERV